MERDKLSRSITLRIQADDIGDNISNLLLIQCPRITPGWHLEDRICSRRRGSMLNEQVKIGGEGLVIRRLEHRVNRIERRDGTIRRTEICNVPHAISRHGKARNWRQRVPRPCQQYLSG